ncbi:MAG: histidine ammonia-lyase [Bacteroidia bacterium]|jgi:histidine ammonia-lyase|nr:histidine ammonia-lyase [Bacteroidia bacterium]
MQFIIDSSLTLNQVKHIIEQKATLSLSKQAQTKIEKCRQYLNQKMQDEEVVYYGINTGFGSLYNTRISKDELTILQKNLLLSHACGTGDEVPAHIVKLMLLLKIQSLSYGNSGVQLSTVERLIYFFNHDILPVVYQQGSLGASGDLAPLAHLSLPLLGLGEVNYKGQCVSAKEVHEILQITPIELHSKEGLALINGTQFMLAYAVDEVINAEKLYTIANTVAAISIDAFDARIEPFSPLLHQIRPHVGQVETAKQIRDLLGGSEIITSPKQHVQDPYAFRCIPQVHGATFDTIKHVANVIETEMNSVTDNPNVFIDDDVIISGGNFHGQPLALVLDFLAIAVAELGSISERRTYQLISGSRNLPPFLTPKPGINSGFMIPQYTAASIVSQNKQLCTPASVDSIVSSNGQEDHVSMGANAATKCYKIIENVYTILAIELLNAAQAIEFRRPLKSSIRVENILTEFRELVSFNNQDRALYLDINLAKHYLRQNY